MGTQARLVVCGALCLFLLFSWSIAQSTCLVRYGMDCLAFNLNNKKSNSSDINLKTAGLIVSEQTTLTPITKV